MKFSLDVVDDVELQILADGNTSARYEAESSSFRRSVSRYVYRIRWITVIVEKIARPIEPEP